MKISSNEKKYLESALIDLKHCDAEHLALEMKVVEEELIDMNINYDVFKHYLINDALSNTYPYLFTSIYNNYDKDFFINCLNDIDFSKETLNNNIFSNILLFPEFFIPLHKELTNIIKTTPQKFQFLKKQDYIDKLFFTIHSTDIDENNNQVLNKIQSINLRYVKTDLILEMFKYSELNKTMYDFYIEKMKKSPYPNLKEAVLLIIDNDIIQNNLRMMNKVKKVFFGLKK